MNVIWYHSGLIVTVLNTSDLFERNGSLDNYQKGEEEGEGNEVTDSVSIQVPWCMTLYDYLIIVYCSTISPRSSHTLSSSAPNPPPQTHTVDLTMQAKPP